MLEEKVVQDSGLQVHVIPTKKYKTTTLVLQVKSALNRDTAAIRALLANVLQSAADKWRSRKEIRLYLDDLYGASFYTDVQKKGEHHIISIRMEIANERYLKEAPPLFHKSVSFLQSILEDPYLPSGQFSEKVVKEEKRTLKQRIQSIYDDKMRYANKRLLEVMCENEPFSVHPYGEAEEVENTTLEELTEEYTRMLREDDMCLYIVGDVDTDEAKRAASAFSITPGPEPDSPNLPRYQAPESPKEEIETDDISQGKLHLGYRTPITFSDDRFPAMQVMNGLFGGFPNSKLFINVREKESMAYYAASRYDSQKGIILVMAGIEVEDYEKAKAIITRQMEDIREGQFSEDDVEQTKSMVKNQLLETADNPKGLIELYYQGRMTGHSRPLEKWLDAVDTVSKEDVTACAAGVDLDMIYFLRSEEDNA